MIMIVRNAIWRIAVYADQVQKSSASFFLIILNEKKPTFSVI